MSPTIDPWILDRIREIDRREYEEQYQQEFERQEFEAQMMAEPVESEEDSLSDEQLRRLGINTGTISPRVTVNTADDIEEPAIIGAGLRIGGTTTISLNGDNDIRNRVNDDIARLEARLERVEEILRRYQEENGQDGQTLQQEGSAEERTLQETEE